MVVLLVASRVVGDGDVAVMGGDGAVMVVVSVRENCGTVIWVVSSLGLFLMIVVHECGGCCPDGDSFGLWRKNKEGGQSRMKVRDIDLT